MALNLPVDVRALYAAGKRLKADRERPVRIAVLVEIDAPDSLVEAAKEMLHPRTDTAIVDVAVVEPDTMLRVDGSADAAIVLAGSGTHLGATLKDLQTRAIPTVVVALGGDAVTFARAIGHPTAAVLVGQDPSEIFTGPLADWLIEKLGKLQTALGHNFGFVRHAVAKEAVRRCAMQNAVVGAIVFLPGADMPIMTLNQGRMLLNIAAAYGQPIDKARIKELGAVVAGGFLFRTVARELVGLVPGFGWAAKAGIAYSGTVAMGSAAIAYFEEGADLTTVARRLMDHAGEAAAQVGQRLPHRGTYAQPVCVEPVRIATVSAGSALQPPALQPPALQPPALEAPAVSLDRHAQAVLIDVPPSEPKFVVLDDSDPRALQTGHTL